VRIVLLHLRARAALAAAAARRASGAGTDRELLRQAARDAKRLERERAPWASGLAKLIRAGAAAVADDDASARDLLAGAAQALDGAEMVLYATAARRRLGELMGGDEGRRIVARVDEGLAAKGVRNPALMVAMLAPGFAAGRGGSAAGR
jgi:hypothetical protein